MSEAAKSFVVSNALAENGIDTPQDLAVIETPLQKFNPHTQQFENAAISIRVGDQTRLAHLRYFAEQGTPKQKEEILKYAVRRALHLPLNAPIGNAQYQSFLTGFTSNLANQAAHYTDLQFVHGSLTYGNQTLQGHPIDYGTFLSLDAQHGDLTYLGHQFKAGDQSDDLKLYLAKLVEFLPPEFKERGNDYAAQYHRQYKETLTRLWLKRLGLSDLEISGLTDAAKDRFYQAATAVLKSSGTTTKNFYAGSFTPAAFDLREIFKNSLKISQLPPSEQAQQWEKVFLTQRSWGTLKPFYLDGVYKKVLDYYTSSIQEISGAIKSDLTPAIARAESMGANLRPERDFLDTQPLIQTLRSPSSSLERNNEEANKLIQKLVDRVPEASGLANCVARGLEEMP